MRSVIDAVDHQWCNSGGMSLARSSRNRSWLRFQPATHGHERGETHGEAAPRIRTQACQHATVLDHDPRYRWGTCSVSISSEGFTLGSEKGDDNEPPVQAVFGLKDGDETISPPGHHAKG